jgi:hypothetical protein
LKKKSETRKETRNPKKKPDTRKQVGRPWIPHVLGAVAPCVAILLIGNNLWVSNPNPETRNPKPETQNPIPLGIEPEARNPKPETQNPKPET